MDRLPQEILELIVAALPSRGEHERSLSLLRPAFLRILPPLSAYACVSRNFQIAVERRNFEHLVIEDHELQVLTSLLTRRRQAYVRFLDVTVGNILPEYLDSHGSQYETRTVQQRNSELFTRFMHDLLSLLRTWEGEGRLNLKVNAELSSPSDSPPEDHHHERIWRYRRSRLRLTRPIAEFPMVPILGHLTFYNAPLKRCVAPSVAAELAQRMPSLGSLKIDLWAREFRYPGVLRDDRRDLAAELDKAFGHLAQLKNFHCTMTQDGGPYNESLPMPQLLYPQKYDVLGSAIRRNTQNVCTIEAQGIFDSTIFYPHPAEPNPTPPLWQKLGFLELVLERNTPSGWWYFMPEGDQDFGTRPRDPTTNPVDDYPPYYVKPVSPSADGDATQMWERINQGDEDHWGEIEEGMCRRRVPCEATIQPLLMAFARAILNNMPVLKRGSIQWDIEAPEWINREDEDTFGISYHAPDGEISNMDWCVSASTPSEHLKAARKIYLRNLRGWRPVQTTMDMLLKVGADTYPGSGMVEVVHNWKKERRRNSSGYVVNNEENEDEQQDLEWDFIWHEIGSGMTSSDAAASWDLNENKPA